jgi:alpha-ketoglutarate-dependent taurine dioxygenase
MEKKPGLKARIKQSAQTRKAEIDLADVHLTQTSYLQPGQNLPLVIQPAMEGVSLPGWAKGQRDVLQAELMKHGGILFHNFGIESAATFEEFARAVSLDGDLYDEYGDLPREDKGTKVYGSTPYPIDKSILFHNESSHMHRWPMKILFFCVKAAEEGGATPIVDCRTIYQALPQALIDRLTEKKLMYTRNFIEGLDVSWQQFFGTHDKARVEQYCRLAGIEFEWKNDRHLKTRQVCQAMARHPYTGEMLFFNQIQLHHVSMLDKEVRESMLAMFGEEDLPRNVYYGDGTPLEDSVVQEISETLTHNAVRFQWQAGDIVLLDNMLVAHSRDPFKGTRKILVAMAEMVNASDQQSGQTR